MNKKEARERGRKERKEVLDRKEKDKEIFSNLLPYLIEAKTIGLYISLEEEVDTFPIIEWCLENGKKVFVPKLINKKMHMIQIENLESLSLGVFGILEPKEGKESKVEDIEVMVVPVVAFDEACHRVGQGKGYYDSVLSPLNKKIGLAYKRQKVEGIEVDPWDITLDSIITEDGVLT